MTDTELLAVEERAKAATEGPWSWSCRHSSPPCERCVDEQHTTIHAGEEVVVVEWAEYAGDAGLRLEPEDGVFIQAARSDIPALVAALREARRDSETLAKVATILNAYHNGGDPDGGFALQQIAAALGKPF